jgi:hypothetical protein
VPGTPFGQANGEEQVQPKISNELVLQAVDWYRLGSAHRALRPLDLALRKNLGARHRALNVRRASPHGHFSKLMLPNLAESWLVPQSSSLIAGPC